jgi:hypothetical protein
MRCKTDSGSAAIKRGIISVTINNSANEKTEPSVGTKKPYETPSFRFERVFEVSALSCGKIGSTSSGCHSNPKKS